MEKNQNGEYEMFCAGQPAWHHLGQNVKEAPNWQEAMKLAHLDWYVQKRQLEYAGQKIDAWGNFRADSNKFLGAVGPAYEPIQNVKGFEFTNTLLQSHQVKYESAGALFGGQRIWLLARIPTDIRIAGTDDITKNYFLFMNRHDGINSAVGKMCNQRVVCNNTLQMALKEDTSTIKIRHTKTQKEQFTEAEQLMLASTDQIKDMDSLMNTLAKVQLDITSIGSIIKTVYGKLDESVQEQNKARNVLEIFEDNDKNAFPTQRGTAYNLLNAFTKYEDHFSSARVAANEDEKKARARKAMFGIGETFKFQVLTAITNHLHKNQLASFDTNIVKLAA